MKSEKSKIHRSVFTVLREVFVIIEGDIPRVFDNKHTTWFKTSTVKNNIRYIIKPFQVVRGIGENKLVGV